MVICEVNQINISFLEIPIYFATHKKGKHTTHFGALTMRTEYGKLDQSKRPKMLQNDYKETKKKNITNKYIDI